MNAGKVLLLLILESASSAVYSDTTIHTTHGDIQGLELSVLGRAVNVYLGIPYATIPARFKPPQRAEAWEGVFEAVTLPPSCPEVPYLGKIRLLPNPITPFEEVCLFLNIWAPQTCPSNEGGDETLTTMVWIHGGGFEWGSSTVPIYDGQVLAATQCVIVVSINYRLGPLGFLSLGNELAPGNVGLLDQNMALKWIHENIESFGGSRNKITIFGESAGSFSVSAHIASPLSRDLFSRAILQSGPPTLKLLIQNVSENIQSGLLLAQALNCPIDNYDAMISCMSSVDSVKLSRTVNDLEGRFKFGIVVDGYFLEKPLGDSYINDDIKTTTIMIGVTKHDGYFILSIALPKLDMTSRPQVDQNIFERLLGKFALPVLADLPDDQLVTKLVEYIYMTSSLPSERDDYLKALANMIHDLTFMCPMYTTVNPFLGKSDVFMYSFDHRSSSTPFPEWIEVGHATEIDFVFGRPLDKVEDFTDEERELSKIMMTAWSNFAKYGNPNGKNKDLPVKWPAFDNFTYPYAIFDLPMLVTTSNGLRHRECTFWNDVSSELRKKLKGKSTGKKHDEL